MRSLVFWSETVSKTKSVALNMYLPMPPALETIRTERINDTGKKSVPPELRANLHQLLLVAGALGLEALHHPAAHMNMAPLLRNPALGRSYLSIP